MTFETMKDHFDLIILALLEKAPTYSGLILREVSQRSGSNFDFGTLAFDRNLVNAGYIKCRYALIGDTKGLPPLHLVHDFDNRTGGGNPIRFYEITNQGNKNCSRDMQYLSHFTTVCKTS